jgi:dienelactone hydrolase
MFVAGITFAGGMLVAVPWLATAQARDTAQGVTHSRGPDLLGAYRFSDGRIIAIAVSSPAWRYIDYTTGEAHQLRPIDSLRFRSSTGWREETGEQILYRFELDPDGRGRLLTVQRQHGLPVTARRVALREETTTFQSGDLKLFGKLVRPASGRGPFPVVVFVHGSGNESAVTGEEFPYLVAANGLAGFVYDKRGTGRSDGHYTQLFGPLSDDVVAAVHWLEARPEIDPGRIGLAGFSQGGWIAPLAALKEPAIKFVVVGYGLAMSIAAQDSLEAPLTLKALGFDSAAIGQFEDLNNAVHRVVRLGFVEGWDDVEAKVAVYRQTKWFAAMRGTPTWVGSILGMGLDSAKAVGPQLLKTYFDPYYDPIPTLESLNIPMLWLIAADDITAPPGPTLAALERLRGLGKPFETIVFPHADHGMEQFIERGGRRVYTKYADGYFSTLVAWLRRQTAR